MQQDRHQEGYIYEASGVFYVRYYKTELIDGNLKRVQRSKRLCEKDSRHVSATCKAVKQKRDEFMLEINSIRPSERGDITLAAYWKEYLEWARKTNGNGEQNLRESTLHGYEQIWSQHLEPRLGRIKMRDLSTPAASRLLEDLAAKYGRRTVAHVKTVASAVFSHALQFGDVDKNPWRGAKSLTKPTDPEQTPHYTLAEAKAIIAALESRPDLQALFALAFYLGLRPSEIVGLQWADFSETHVHIQRGVVRGVVAAPKTKESVKQLPLIEPVKGPVDAWRAKCPESKGGWVFPGERTTETRPRYDFRDLVQDGIRPLLKEKGITWKGLYAARRGAGTALVGFGNLVAAQELLRHKSLSTTLAFYKKTTESALQEGMAAFEQAAKK